jgi:hypothetical protein
MCRKHNVHRKEKVFVLHYGKGKLVPTETKFHTHTKQQHRCELSFNCVKFIKIVQIIYTVYIYIHCT